MLANKLLPVFLVLTTLCAFQLTLTQQAQPVTSNPQSFLGQVNPSCSRYMCAPAGMNLAPNACVHYEDSTYYLQSCSNRTDSLTYCSPTPAENGYDSFCQAPPIAREGMAWPGEKCATNSTCITNYCSEANGLCVGAGRGGSCESNAECGAGLFCTGSQCTQQRALGQTCTTDFDCANSLGCNKTSLFYGVCLQYFSVPVGGRISDCNGNSTSYLCISGTCLQQSFNGAGICIKPITSTSQTPQSCQSDQTCVGTSTGQSFQSACQCGINPTGASYCQPFLGDQAGRNWLYYLTQLAYLNATQQCNTNRRFNSACVNSLPITWGKTAVAFSLLYQNYPQLQGNDNCIKAIYTAYYWSISPGYWLAVSAAVFTFF